MEVRFKTKIFSSAVFGIIFNRIKEEFPVVTKLPILTLPDQLRETDPNLVYLPYYRLESEKFKDFIIQIGPRVFSVAVINSYPGWNVFLERINYGLKSLESSSVVATVERFALRYLNFFDFNIFDQSRLTIQLDNKPLESKYVDFRAEVQDGEFLNVIKIRNNAAQQKANDPTKTIDGSVIDIDTVINKEVHNFFQVKDGLLEGAHKTEKKWFFTIVSEKYLESLDEVKFDN